MSVSVRVYECVHSLMLVILSSVVGVTVVVVVVEIWDGRTKSNYYNFLFLERCQFKMSQINSFSVKCLVRRKFVLI